MHAMAFAMTLFVLGVLSVVSIVADLPVVFTIAFIAFLIVLAAWADFDLRRRRRQKLTEREKLIEAGSFEVDSYMHFTQQRIRQNKDVQTMQIKVEADTSEAVAAIEQLEQRVAHCAAQVQALHRLAIHHVMEGA